MFPHTLSPKLRMQWVVDVCALTLLGYSKHASGSENSSFDSVCVLEDVQKQIDPVPSRNSTDKMTRKPSRIIMPFLGAWRELRIPCLDKITAG